MNRKKRIDNDFEGETESARTVGHALAFAVEQGKG